MYRVIKRMEISGAHKLSLPYESKCRGLHGHNWIITIYCKSKELNANGRTVDSDGYVVDGDGFIAIASPYGADEIGTVVETPFGLGRVYDVCEDGSYDVYTSW